MALSTLPAARRRLTTIAALLVVALPAVAGTRSAAWPLADDADDARSIYLVLRLGERRLHVMEGDDRDETGRRLASFPVAVGRPEYATPTGRFRVVEKIEDPDFVQFDWNDPSHVVGRLEPGPDNPLGARWIGFTAAYGWTIGFHGTPQPELLGQAVSHGCVRMRNSDVLQLYRRVEIGTPVIVEP